MDGLMESLEAIEKERLGGRVGWWLGDMATRPVERGHPPTDTAEGSRGVRGKEGRMRERPIFPITKTTTALFPSSMTDFVLPELNENDTGAWGPSGTHMAGAFRE